MKKIKAGEATIIRFKNEPELDAYIKDRVIQIRIDRKEVTLKKDKVIEVSQRILRKYGAQFNLLIPAEIIENVINGVLDKILKEAN